MIFVNDYRFWLATDDKQIYLVMVRWLSLRQKLSSVIGNSERVIETTNSSSNFLFNVKNWMTRAHATKELDELEIYHVPLIVFKNWVIVGEVSY